MGVIFFVLKFGLDFLVGQYYVDVIVNQENVGKVCLFIMLQEELVNVLCLLLEWLKVVGVFVCLEGYVFMLNVVGQCYVFSCNFYIRVDFSYGFQSLVFSIFQLFLVGKMDFSCWDYGVLVVCLKYFVNVLQMFG